MKRTIIFTLGLMIAMPLRAMEPQKPATLEEIEAYMRAERQRLAQQQAVSYFGYLPMELGQRTALFVEQRNFLDSLTDQEVEKVKEILKGEDLVDATDDQKLQLLEALIGMRVKTRHEYFTAQIQNINNLFAFKNFETIARDPLYMGKLIQYIGQKTYYQSPHLSLLVKIALNLDAPGAYEWLRSLTHKNPDVMEELNNLLVEL